MSHLFISDSKDNKSIYCKKCGVKAGIIAINTRCFNKFKVKNDNNNGNKIQILKQPIFPASAYIAGTSLSTNSYKDTVYNIDAVVAASNMGFAAFM